MGFCFAYSIIVSQFGKDRCDSTADTMRIHPRLLLDESLFTHVATVFSGEFDGMLDKPWIAAINGYANLSKYIDNKGVS